MSMTINTRYYPFLYLCITSKYVYVPFHLFCTKTDIKVCLHVFCIAQTLLVENLYLIIIIRIHND